MSREISDLEITVFQDLGGEVHRYVEHGPWSDDLQRMLDAAARGEEHAVLIHARWAAKCVELRLKGDV